MSNDLRSVPSQIAVLAACIIIYGIFTAINTSLGSSGRNTEKYQTACKLMQLASVSAGAFFAAAEWWMFLIYVVVLLVLGQFFPRKLALQHDESMAEKCLPVIELISTVLRPFTFFLMLFADILLKLFRQETDVVDGQFYEEEVMSMLEVGQESGVLKEEGPLVRLNPFTMSTVPLFSLA